MRQWQLVHVGLAAVRFVNENPEIWSKSYIACNLNPLHRISFSEWCDKISSDLEAGQQFKPETSSDIYSLLPSFWHGMEPSEKKAVMAVIAEFDGTFTVDCVRKLKAECNIPTKDLQNLRVCYETAKKYPEHLEMTVPSSEAQTVAPEVVAAEAALKPATHDLVNFELKPKGLKGQALFEHMSQFVRRQQKRGETLEPSAFLDVEITDDQRAILAPSERDLTCGALMADAGGQGAQKKLAKRKLDNLGDIKAHSGVQNDPERIRKLKATAELSASISEIVRLDKAEKVAKKVKMSSDLLGKGPAALAKLKSKGGDVDGLTKGEIASVALKYYGQELSLNPKKPELVASLSRLITANPGALECGSATDGQADAVTNAPDDESDQDNDSDSD